MYFKNLHIPLKESDVGPIRVPVRRGGVIGLGINGIDWSTWDDLSSFFNKQSSPVFEVGRMHHLFLPNTSITFCTLALFQQDSIRADSITGNAALGELKLPFKGTYWRMIRSPLFFSSSISFTLKKHIIWGETPSHAFCTNASLIFLESQRWK